MSSHRSFPSPERELQSASEVSRRSERRDREFIRQALERQLSEEEIRGNLGKTSEFHRLNPKQDLLVYIRGLIEEESSGSNAGLGEQAIPAVAKRNQARTPAAVEQPKDSPRASSEAMARQYIRENFEPSDWLAVVLRSHESGETIQRIATAGKIASPSFQSWLRYKNAHGADIYLSLNTLNEHARSRTKADVKEIRHLYLDLDSDGRQKLGAIERDAATPDPNYVLNTSPGKFQVIWKVAEMRPEESESLLRSLTQRFGGDPAATDSTRVFRLPGFNNKKYPENFTVTVQAGPTPEVVYHRADFALENTIGDHSSTGPQLRASNHSPRESRKSQSERDWSYALRRLQHGDAPETVVREIAAFRSADRNNKGSPQGGQAKRKANPRYYAERTVKRALESLGLVKPKVQELDPQTEHASRETSPSR
jgi:hypothetical protein